jgi:hypothetical protein
MLIVLLKCAAGAVTLFEQPGLQMSALVLGQRRRLSIG